MSASSFRINQPPATGYTYWDRARRDLVLGDVECEAQNKSESSYLWEIISAPPGGTIIITNPTSHTCQFTLVTRYGYLIRLTTNAGEIDESQTTLYMGVALSNSGAYLPALNETNQDNSQSPYDGSRGTEEKINDALIKFDGGYSWIYDGVNDYLYPQSATARIKVASGTLANPTFGFKDDIDTGVYLPSAGIMSFVSGGSEVFRMHIDTGDSVIESPGLGDFFIKNEGNPVASEVSLHIESRITDGNPSGSSIYILSDSYNGKTSDVSIRAEAPGGTSSSQLTATTEGVSGGSATTYLQSLGAGVTNVHVFSTTTGAYAANIQVASTSPSAAAITSVSASGNDATSYVHIGGNHCKITFDDYLRTGSTYTSQLLLSSSQSEWNNFVSDFGVVSILDSIYQSAHKTLQNAYDNGNSIATSTGNSVSISGTGGSNDVVYISTDNTGYAALVLNSSDNDNPWLVLRSQDTYNAFGIGYNQSIHFWTGGTIEDSGNIILTTASNAYKDHGRYSTGNPGLYLFSATDVTSDDTQWMSFYRTSTQGEIQFGDETDVSSCLYVRNTLKVYGPVLNENVSTISISSGALLLNMNYGNFMTANVNANITSVTPTTPPGVGRYQVVFTGAGSYTINWSGWHWEGSQPPFSIANTEVRIMTFYYDGTNYYASMSGVFS